jgi:hypothetical protein
VEVSELNLWKWAYKNCGEHCEIDRELIDL